MNDLWVVAVTVLFLCITSVPVVADDWGDIEPDNMSDLDYLLRFLEEDRTDAYVTGDSFKRAHQLVYNASRFFWRCYPLLNTNGQVLVVFMMLDSSCYFVNPVSDAIVHPFDEGRFYGLYLPDFFPENTVDVVLSDGFSLVQGCILGLLFAVVLFCLVLLFYSFRLVRLLEGQ